MNSNGLKKQIRLLTRADRLKVESLLSITFKSANGFSTSPDTHKWTVTDDYYPCFGIFFGDRLVSYMRCEWIEDATELEIKLGEIPNLTFDYPIGYMAKAATHPEFQNLGLYVILRYHQLRVFNYWGVQSVIGTMAEGSPRINSMKKMGYFFLNMKRPWNGAFKSDRQILMAILDGQNKIKTTIQKIEAEKIDLLSQFNVNFSLSEVPRQGRAHVVFPWQTKKQTA